jgi:hypothetical protein
LRSGKCELPTIGLPGSHGGVTALRQQLFSVDLQLVDGRLLEVSPRVRRGRGRSPVHLRNGKSVAGLRVKPHLICAGCSVLQLQVNPFNFFF